MTKTTGKGLGEPSPKQDPNCQCVCHTQPGVLHAVACCHTPKPRAEDGAPERIWATEDAENHGEDRFHSTRPMRGLTEYVRSDLYEAERAARENAEAERVTEWNRRRDAEASRDVEKAVAETQRAAREAAEAHTAASVKAERVRVAALVDAGRALVDFHNAPVAAKRPDVFQRRIAALASALAALEPEAGE